MLAPRHAAVAPRPTLVPATRPPATEVTIAFRVTAEPAELAHVAARLLGYLRELVGVSSARVLVEARPPGPAIVRPPRTGATLRILVTPRRVLLHGAELRLTRLEFDLLLFLCSAPGRVHTRAALMAGVWHTPADLGARTVDVHVLRLRRKLGADLGLIYTVRGVGYRVDNQHLLSIEDG
jgi:DNA-binding response OmpR family regulator